MIDPTTNADLATGGTAVSSTSLETDGLARRSASTASSASAGNGHDRIHRFAGTMHRAIDRLQQRLSSAGGGMSSTQARYGEQARRVGDRLRTRVNEQPLQSAGIVLAAGVLLDRLFLRKTKVRVVRMPVPTRSAWEAGPVLGPSTRRWSDAADAHLQRVGRASREAADRAGMAAASGLVGTRARVSSLAREANTLPLQMRLATQRLMARSQEYGSMARSTVEAHPWAGLGAVLAASGLLTTAVMRRRDPASGMAYTASNDRADGSALQRSEYRTQTGLGGMISSRPVTSGMVVIGLGVLASAMLRRRME